MTLWQSDIWEQITLLLWYAIDELYLSSNPSDMTQKVIFHFSKHRILSIFKKLNFTGWKASPGKLTGRLLNHCERSFWLMVKSLAPIQKIQEHMVDLRQIEWTLKPFWFLT